jgi:hypothetical protein
MNEEGTSACFLLMIVTFRHKEKKGEHSFCTLLMIIHDGDGDYGDECPLSLFVPYPSRLPISIALYFILFFFFFAVLRVLIYFSHY